MWGNIRGNLKFITSRFIHLQNTKNESQRLCVFHIDTDIFVNCNWVDTQWSSEKNKIFPYRTFPFPLL